MRDSLTASSMLFSITNLLLLRGALHVHKAAQCETQSASKPTRDDGVLKILFLAHLFSQALQDKVALRSTSSASENEWVEIAVLYFSNAFAVLANLRALCFVE